MTLATAVAKGCAVLLTAWVATLGAATAAVAQGTFPAKPVKLIVPCPPGGASDNTARLLAQGALRAVGQNEYIERTRTRRSSARRRGPGRVSR